MEKLTEAVKLFCEFLIAEDNYKGYTQRKLEDICFCGNGLKELFSHRIKRDFLGTLEDVVEKEKISRICWRIAKNGTTKIPEGHCVEMNIVLRAIVEELYLE